MLRWLDISLDPKVLYLAEKIRKALQERGISLSTNDILYEALRLYEKVKVSGEEDLVIELWDKVEKLESEVKSLKRDLLALREAQPVVTAAQPPTLAPPKPVAKKPPEKKEDKLLEFLKDAIFYPLDKIRAPRSRIDDLIDSGILEVLDVGGKQYVVYKDKLEELMEKLPLPLDEVKKLPRKMRSLLELLKGAALVYEDSITKTIKKV